MHGYVNLKELPEEKIGDKITRRILVGDKGMVVFWQMKAGAHAARHQHPHEQIFWMISGRMEFDLDGEKRVCRAGDCGVIPGNTPHEAYFPGGHRGHRRLRATARGHVHRRGFLPPAAADRGP